MRRTANPETTPKNGMQVAVSNFSISTSTDLEEISQAES
jgi:hypothetical protein